MIFDKIIVIWKINESLSYFPAGFQGAHLKSVRFKPPFSVICIIVSKETFGVAPQMNLLINEFTSVYTFSGTCIQLDRYSIDDSPETFTSVIFPQQLSDILCQSINM